MIVNGCGDGGTKDDVQTQAREKVSQRFSEGANMEIR